MSLYITKPDYVCDSMCNLSYVFESTLLANYDYDDPILIKPFELGFTQILFLVYVNLTCVSISNLKSYINCLWKLRLLINASVGI